MFCPLREQVFSIVNRIIANSLNIPSKSRTSTVHIADRWASVMAIRSACQRLVSLAAFCRYLAQSLYHRRSRRQSEGCVHTDTAAHAHLHTGKISTLVLATLVHSRLSAAAFLPARSAAPKYECATRRRTRTVFARSVRSFSSRRRQKSPYGSNARSGQVEPIRLVHGCEYICFRLHVFCASAVAKFLQLTPWLILLNLNKLKNRGLE